MAQQDRIYFAQRAAEEMEAAKAASSPEAVAAHTRLQRRYLERALVGGRVADQSEDGLFGDNRASFSRVLEDG